MWPWFALGIGSLVVLRIATGKSRGASANALVQMMRQAIMLDPQTQGMKWAVVVVENFPDRDKWNVYVEVAYEFDRQLDAKAYFDNMLLKSRSAVLLVDIEAGTIAESRSAA